VQKVTGQNGAENSDYFDSVLDDVRLYNRVLTPHEIQRLYNQGGR
jgi:hypothetical protein